MTRGFQGAFNGGILSPTMYSRTDVSKYATGLKDAKNMVILAEGGIENRAGFTLASGFDTSTFGGARQVLIPFEFSVDDTYMLEFGETNMRVIKNGAYVLDSSVAAQDITSISDANPAVITMASGAAAANFTNGDLAYVQDPNGSHFLHQQIVRVTGVATADISFEVYDQTAIDATTNTTTLGAGATLSLVYHVAHPFTLADVPEVNYAQDVDTLYLVNDGYDVRTLQRISDDDWTFSTVTFAPVATPPAITQGLLGPSPFPASNFTQTDPGTFRTTAATGTPSEGDTIGFTGVGGMTQLNNNIYVAGPVTGFGTFTIDILDLEGVDLDATGFTAWTAGGNVHSGLFALATTGTGTTDYRYKVAAIVNGEESLPSEEISCQNDLTVAGNQNTIAWTPVAGATAYVIYKSFSGIFGYIGQSTERIFVDENITPDTSQTPQQARNPFSGAGNRPSVVTFIEQRLALAATLNQPQLVEMSQSVNPLNFNRSATPVDSDAISFLVRSQKLNRITALIPNEPHYMLTTGAEWTIDGGDQKGYLTPANPIVRPRAYRGSARFPSPVLVGDAVLHVQGDGRTVRELAPASKAYSADMTLLARHLFKNRSITSWAYAQAPHSVVWVTLDDGTLLSMTYLIEHEVWGWTRHTLGGTNAQALQVAVVREGDVDTPYIVVSRTVNSRTVRMTERLDPREFARVEDAYFVDGGFKTTISTPTSTLRGYLHLRGEDATVLADGNVLEALSFDAFGLLDMGTYTAEDTVSAGLGYDAFITTLGIDFGVVQGLGSTTGRYKATSDVAVHVVDTRGIAVGREDGPVSEVVEFTGASPIPLATKTHLITVEGDWVRDARITVAQNYPLPMRLTNVAPDWELEDA